MALEAAGSASAGFSWNWRFFSRFCCSLDPPCSAHPCCLCSRALLCSGPSPPPLPRVTSRNSTSLLAVCVSGLSWHVSLRRCARFFRFLLVFEVLHCLPLPCGLCVCASLPPGPSSLHPGPTPRLPFPGRNSPGSFVLGGPFLVSFRPAPDRVSPHFIVLALSPGAALVPRPFPVFRFSVHEAASANQLQFPCSTVSWGRLKGCSRRREWRRRLRASVLKRTLPHVTAPAVIARPREASNSHLVAQYLLRAYR